MEHFSADAFQHIAMQHALVAQQMHELLQLRSNLASLTSIIQQRFVAGLLLFLPWLAHSTPMSTGSCDVCLVGEPSLGLAGDSDFARFRDTSCQSPMRYKDGLPARVWRSGAVQVVQALSVIPLSLHPRSRLGERELGKLAEGLYIPIFNTMRPSRHPVVVLEVFFARNSCGFLIADVISFVETAVLSMGMSVSNPTPQTNFRSSLSGRRALAPDSAEDLQMRQDESVPGRPAMPGLGPSQAHGAAVSLGRHSASGSKRGASEAIRTLTPLPQDVNMSCTPSPLPAAPAALSLLDSASDHMGQRPVEAAEASSVADHEDTEAHTSKVRRLTRSYSMHACMSNKV